MAWWIMKPGATYINSFTMKGTETIIRVGDCVWMRSRDRRMPHYVARVEKIEKDTSNNLRVQVRLYYRPEDTTVGRRKFNGVNELFLTDHYDIQSVDAIERKCYVHTLNEYIKLQNAGANDFYSRFQYYVLTGAITPDRIRVYCICEMPYNPDIFMLHCVRCRDWFHFDCLGMTLEHARSLNNYVCSNCSSNNEENDATDMEEGDENSWTDDSTDEEDNSNTQESSQVPSLVNPNIEKMEIQAEESSYSNTPNSGNNTEMEVSSTRRVMNVLNNMNGLESGSTLWFKTLYLLEDPIRRVFFLNMKDDACRLAWINFRCGIESD